MFLSPIFFCLPSPPEMRRAKSFLPPPLPRPSARSHHHHQLEMPFAVSLFNLGVFLRELRERFGPSHNEKLNLFFSVFKSFFPRSKFASQQTLLPHTHTKKKTFQHSSSQAWKVDLGPRAKEQLTCQLCQPLYAHPTNNARSEQTS